MWSGVHMVRNKNGVHDVACAGTYNWYQLPRRVKPHPCGGLSYISSSIGISITAPSRCTNSTKCLSRILVEFLTYLSISTFNTFISFVQMIKGTHFHAFDTSFLIPKFLIVFIVFPRCYARPCALVITSVC